jgi:hypothetical protein
MNPLRRFTVPSIFVCRAAHLLLGACLFISFSGQTSAPGTSPSLDARYHVSDVLFSDDFAQGMGNWKVEAEKAARVEAKEGVLTIDSAVGCTVWFTQKMSGRVLISYEARVVNAGGPNDRLSDLNCFWMATDTQNANDLFAVKRSGKFPDYNLLKCYYVGLGGNNNTTTRFRRYIGDAEERPLLAGNDLRDAADLLKANEWQTITLVADGQLVQFFRDGKKLFELEDAEPYRAGHFAFRTTRSHLELRNFQVFRLVNVVH